VIGTKFSVLQQQGYIDPGTDVCPQQGSSKKLQDEGVYLYPRGAGANAVLAEVGLTKATYATVSGARVGDTMKKLKQLYGAQLKVETKNGNGGPFKVANVRIGAREVVFIFPWDSAMVDTDKVQSIMARNWSTDLMGEC
jgi:molybdopterin converting factor small subunit